MDDHSAFYSSFLVEGVLLGLLGVLMVLKPFESTLILEYMLGFVFLIAGTIQTLESFKSYKLRSFIFWPLFFSGIVTVLCGFLLLFYPIAILKTLTFLLAIYFAVKALLEFIAAAIFKPSNLSWWLFANGVIMLLLVIVIWHSWPLTSYMLIGLLVGINLIMSGISRIIVGSKGKHLML